MSKNAKQLLILLTVGCAMFLAPQFAMSASAVAPASLSLSLQAAEEKETFYMEEIPLGEDVQQYLYDTAEEYDISPFLILAIIEKESQFTEDAKNGDCSGLMQVSSKWHSKRLEDLGGEDLFDAKDNILCGTDFLHELFEEHQDPILVLMMYNMKASTAKRLYGEGQYSSYALGILERAEELESEYYGS